MSNRNVPPVSFGECFTEHLSTHPEILVEMAKRSRELGPLMKELNALLDKQGSLSPEEEAKVQELRDRIKAASNIDITIGFKSGKPGHKTPRAAEEDNAFAGPGGFLQYVQASGDTFTTGATRMPNTWSRSFIHGSDALLPVLRLAGHILRPGEKIEGLGSVNWRKPMTSNIQVAVMRGPMGRDPKSVMDGSIKTTEGELGFVAQLIGEPLPGVIQADNPYSTVCSCPDCLTVKSSGLHKFTLPTPIVPNWERALQDPALAVATMTELLTEAVDNMDLPGKDTAFFRLMGGISNLPLPNRPEDLFKGSLKIRTKQDTVCEGKSGITIVPFEYAFPHQNSLSRGFVALTDKPEVVSRVMRG